MDKKLLLTQTFLKGSGLPSDEKTIEKYLKLWWANPRLNGNRSLALTEQGFNYLQTFGLRFYEVRLPEKVKITNQMIIWLDKYIDCPFYMSKGTIYVTTEYIAVQLMLLDGDISKFGKIKERSKKTT